MRQAIADPEILGGKPVLEGTRLSVEHVLGLLAEGMSYREVLVAYRKLKEEDICAVFSYAAAALHNEVIVETRSMKRVG